MTLILYLSAIPSIFIRTEGGIRLLGVVNCAGLRTRGSEAAIDPHTPITVQGKQRAEDMRLPLTLYLSAILSIASGHSGQSLRPL
jgi:hypothetical protein